MAAMLLGGVLAPAAPAAAAGDCLPSLPACRALDQAQASAAANQSQLAAIQAQLGGVGAQMSALTALIMKVQTQIGEEQIQIVAAQGELDALDQRLRFTSAELDRQQAQLTLRQQLLAQRVRDLDKRNALDYLELIATAQDFTQLVDRLTTWHQVIAADQQLVDALAEQRDQVRTVQDQLEAQRSEQADLLTQLSEQQSQELQQVAVQQAAFDRLRQVDGAYQAQQQAGNQRQVALDGQVSQLDALYQQQLRSQATAPGPGPVSGPVAGQPPPTSGPPGLRPVFPWVPAGGFPDSFPYGQCTYWAAYNHRVSWSGNAADWFGSAAAEGVRTSSSPSVGAVVVWGAGAGYSVYGHVAVVVGVNQSTFTVSEMNYVGLGVVDTRVVAWPGRDIEGFIA